MRNEKGFTYSELLIIMIIMGILAAMAMLYIPNILNSYKVRGAARLAYSDMQMARLKAIKEGKVWCIIFGGSPFTSYRVVEAGANGICDPGVDIVDMVGEKSVNVASEYSGVTMSHNFSDNTLNFNPNGTAEGGTATFCNSSRGQGVVVNNNTGNIRIDNAATC